MFKILHIDHIGIGVNDLAAAKDIFGEKLGMFHQPEDEVVAEQKVKVSFFPCGDAELEFLESTSPDGPIAKAIEKNGGRNLVQHIALRVDNVEAAIADLMTKGVEMLDKAPRYGAGGAKIAFLHPKSTGGILIEICEHPDRNSH
ncbi:MAG: methylmalonyl-CoA epimerase [Negativicutes bacterium]